MARQEFERKDRVGGVASPVFQDVIDGLPQMLKDMAEYENVLDELGARPRGDWWRTSLLEGQYHQRFGDRARSEIPLSRLQAFLTERAQRELCWRGHQTMIRVFEDVQSPQAA